MTSLVIMSMVLRFSLTGYIVYELIRYGNMLNIGERLGLGMAGGTAFLTLAVIGDVNKEGTPFDTWAGMIFSLGWLIYMGSRQVRLLRHEKRNTQAVKQAGAYLRERGKL